MLFRFLHRFSAPRAEIPVLLNDAPLAAAAFVFAAVNLPWFFNFAATPRAVAHERHQ